MMRLGLQGMKMPIGEMTMTSNDTQVSQPLPTLMPEHKRVHVFVGRWKVRGQNKESAPVAPGVKVSGEETYEWLTGGFFLVSRFQHYFGDDAHIGLSTIGYDTSSQTYVSHNFDNMGYARRYEITVDDKTWTFKGEFERATLVFSSDGNSKTEHWEISSDGANWQPLCEMTATKIR
jgi:hypothetical protein